MTLTNLYMQNIQAKPATEYVQPAQQSNSGESFDDYFTRAEEERPVDTQQPPKNNQNKINHNDGYDQDRGNNFKTDKPENTEPENKTDKTQTDKTKTDKTETPDKTENADKTEAAETKTEEFSEEEYDAASREIIEKLASALGVPAEEIQQLLITLNIKPLALSDDTVLNEFVQKLVGAASSAELLTLPNVKETFAAVESVMADYEAIAREFLQKIENEEIGRPKFIDAGRENQPMLAAAAETKGLTETMDADAKPVSGTADEPMTMVKDVEVKTTAAAQSEAETPDQSFGQQKGETAADTLLAEADETAMMINTAMPADPDAPLSFEKINLKAEAMKNINTEDVINQIAEKIKVDVKGEATEIKVSLRPEHLGDVTLKITTQNGIVTAQFGAENQRIKEIIEAGFQNLKDVLQQKGINISQLSVSVGQENAEKQMGYFNQSQEKSSRRVQPAADTVAMGAPVDLESSYINDRELYDIQVDYKA